MPASAPWDRSLFEHALEGIFRSTPEGRFIEVNPALVHMLGYESAEEVLALKLPDDLYVNPAQHAHLRAHYEPRGIIEGAELRWKKKSGGSIVVSLYARVVRDARGHVVGYEGMVLDVTARKQAEERLCLLSHQLLVTQERERRHLARELHDEIGQRLTALKINLRALGPILKKATPHLQESLHIVDSTLQQIRHLSLDLRPSQLDDLGLVDTLRWYVERQAQRLGLIMYFIADPLRPRPSPTLETACFRIVQEALTNIGRHARARRSWVELRRHNAALHLLVRDDGVGFDLGAARMQATRGKGLGLLGIEERVRLVGGQLEIVTASGKGTEIRVCVPLKHTL